MFDDEKKYVEISCLDYEKYKKIFGEFSLSFLLRNEVFEKRNIFPEKILNDIMVVPILFYSNYFTFFFMLNNKYYLIDDLYLFKSGMILIEEHFMEQLRLSV